LPPAGAPASPHPAAGGYRRFLEEGFSDGGQHITIRDSATGAIERELPMGTAAADWSRYYSVASVGGSARLTAIDPASGRTLNQTTIPAGYALPDVVYLGPPAGLSPNRQRLPVTAQARASGGRTAHFLVCSCSLPEC